jgi:REP element-mobilizing transposase RayT
MKYNPDKHHRQSIRLKGYDYTQPGAYGVTIVTKDRLCLLGEITNGEMVLSSYGIIAQRTWLDLPDHYPHIALDEFVIMPNHVHGIIVLTHSDRSQTDSCQRHALSEIIRAFKSFSARRINILRHTPGVPVWQRNYYEHIIRSENKLRHARIYIANNPTEWERDHENPLVIR